MLAEQQGLHREVHLPDGSRVEVEVTQYGPSLRVDGVDWCALADLDWSDLDQLHAILGEAKEVAKCNGWDTEKPLVEGRRTAIRRLR